MAKHAKHTDAQQHRSPSQLLHLALQTALDIYAEEVGPDGLTHRQYAVLSAVAAEEGLTQAALVKITGVDRSTMADVVARMMRKGLLARERSSDDARANAVRLTDGGRTALAATEPRVLAADLRILERLKPSRREKFLDALEALVAAAEPDVREAVVVELQPHVPEERVKKGAKKKAKKVRASA